MADQSQQGDNNSKRKKIIIAGLLALFLVVVILRPTGKSTGSTGVCDGYAPPASLPVPVAKSNQVEQSILPLPVVDLQQVLAYDPFRILPDSDQRASSKEPITAQSTIGSPEIAASLAVPEIPQFEVPVTAIVTGGKRPAALIGERLYYENDVLENGWLIVAIKSSSILVEGQN
jgi:hypothetical protein